MSPSEPHPLPVVKDNRPGVFPPGLVSGPDTESIKHDGWMGIYVVGNQSETLLKSDTTMDVEP